MDDDTETPTRKWCEEARALLKLARLEAPLEDDKPEDTIAPLDTAPDAALLLKTNFQKRFAKDPKGATAVQSARLDKFRTIFANTYSGMPSPERLRLINAVFNDMMTAHAIEAAQCARREALRDRVNALIAEKTKGAGPVPGAQEADTATLESLGDMALASLARADSIGEIAAVAPQVDEVAREREAVELKVEARTKQAGRIESDAAAMGTPPEAPSGSLVAERAAVSQHLGLPLGTDGLAKAEEALVKLRTAWAPVEKEALTLREMRGMFALELAGFRSQVVALESKSSSANKRTAQGILAILDGLPRLLAVDAGRPRTETFPAELDTQKSAILVLIGSMAGGGNQDSKGAAIAFMRDELERCADEAKKLPDIDGTTAGYASAITKNMSTARQLLSVGTGGQAIKARQPVEACSDLVVAWRKYAGPAGIVLAQRKAATVQLIQPGNPADADPAFAVQLNAVRAQVKESLAKKQIEVNVVEAETRAKPFQALLGRATADAAAAKRVAAARLILASEFAPASGAARSAARTELTKVKATADARFVLAGMDRNMALTAKLYEDLVARVREVAAEGSFADTPKAPFNDLDEGVRELAFAVCGPALVTSLDKTARQALSAVLATDGPAIRLLAEGPLGSSPKTFAKVLANCGASGLATLARALDGEPGKGARATLEGLVDKAGLGGNPDLISQLIGEPPKASDNAKVTLAKQQAQIRNAAGLKSLAENFSGGDGQAAMSALMVEGGLSSSGGSLASLMQQGGFDGDGAKLRIFADAFVGDSAGLKRIVGTAGVAEHPAVLGPLAKRAGADGVKSIATAFDKPEDCAKLKALLDGGGMSGDTNLPGKGHEHPDTLTKVFVDGLGGKGENLKTYARAFGGPTGPADSKRMLDAFNEFPDYDETPPKDYRQPGKGIAQLIGGKQLQGTPEQRITKLATQFMPNIKDIPDGDQRKQAIRMAPHMALDTAQEGWKDKSPEMDAANIDRATASVLKRHKPETYDKGKTVYEQSMFAPGTDVGALIDEALAQVTVDRDHAQRVTVHVGPPDAQITVEIGFFNGTAVNHFGPRGSVAPPHPQETPTFLATDIEAIFKAIK